MTSRLNARLDAELARKVKYLRARTRKTTTEVVKASIEAYYKEVASQPSPAELLSDFVACAEGPSRLSLDYKEALRASFERKSRR